MQKSQRILSRNYLQRYCQFLLPKTSQKNMHFHTFVSSSEQIWSNSALHHLLTNGSSAVNGCRQNESPNIHTHGGAREGLAGAPAPPRKTKAPP